MMTRQTDREKLDRALETGIITDEEHAMMTEAMEAELEVASQE